MFGPSEYVVLRTNTCVCRRNPEPPTDVCNLLLQSEDQAETHGKALRVEISIY